MDHSMPVSPRVVSDRAGSGSSPRCGVLRSQVSPAKWPLIPQKTSPFSKGSSPQASGHAYRRRRRRAPSPGVGDSRQLDRRGDERLRLEHHGHAARGRIVGDDRGRRPGYSVDKHPKTKKSARGHLHDAPRRRQVRPGQLQDVRRPARGRRERRQCARRSSSQPCDGTARSGRSSQPRGRLGEQERRGPRHGHDCSSSRFHHFQSNSIRS